MFAMAHDYRIGSKTSRYCLNELEINMYLPPGMMAVVVDKMSDKKLAKEIALQAKVVSAEEALKGGILDQLTEPGQA